MIAGLPEDPVTVALVRLPAKTKLRLDPFIPKVRLMACAVAELFVTSPDKLMALPPTAKAPAPLLKVIPAKAVLAAKSLLGDKPAVPAKNRLSPATGAVPPQ